VVSAAGREARLLTILSDLVAITIAFEATAHLRAALNWMFAAQLDREQIESLVPPLGLILVLWVLTSAWSRLYRPRHGHLFLSTCIQVVECMGLVLVLTIVATFFLRDFGSGFSRSFVLMLGGLGSLGMVSGRLVLWSILRVLGPRTLSPERILIVGAGAATKALLDTLRQSASRALRICGAVVPGIAMGQTVLGDPVPVVGTVEQLASLINKHRVNRVIAVETEIPPNDLRTCISICARMHLPLNQTAGVLGSTPMRLEMAELGGLRLVEVSEVEFTRFQEIAKRAFDVVAAAGLLVVLSPLLAGLALAIKLSSRGPVLYVAPRVGRGGRHFRFFKLRTMVADAEQQRERLATSNEKSGHLFKIDDDPRVIGIGRFLRRFSLDELPQLVNVLTGDMSLVGPRPLPARDLDQDGLSSSHRTWASLRSKVRPGITGLWQVRGRSALDFDEMLSLDVGYVRLWSLKLDITILAETIPAVFRGRGAC
jgi:exopolysaccharide biosynthesis polyprenyl glycosylphosphotransferase